VTQIPLHPADGPLKAHVEACPESAGMALSRIDYI
jgi:hypothetical protein